ncbi:DUF2059 domain-containing protein [Wielerella bovis]|uniref:DUF2059 domain-containing protein n=1 Tax=Wielerella bovis TaxID=2917790 RepID=UPI00201958F1|nr:DUF2059 domain-containing protein [Wielerella bovis]ULJ64558.1 DUF2059 domain-containing protein [Wielerella bovis]ULJ66847.1 DUF2059 domain-containing protein [Wielerella bovis]
MKKYALIIALSLFSQSVWAAPPSDTSLQKLMTIMRIEEQFDQQIKQTHELIEKQITNSWKEHPTIKLSPDKEEQVEAFIRRMVQKAAEIETNKNSRQIYIHAWIHAAKKHYTQEEVDAMIQFYTSPVGQSIMQKQLLFSDEYVKTTEPIMQEQTNELFEYVLQEVVQEMKKIANQ